MRRILRRLFTLAAAVSAALWVATFASAEVSSGRTGLDFFVWAIYPAPDWLIAARRAGPLVFAVLPLVWVVASTKARRPPNGLCPRCGYDLRATPEAGGALLDRCPECGEVPAVPAAGKGAA